MDGLRRAVHSQSDPQPSNVKARFPKQFKCFVLNGAGARARQTSITPVGAILIVADPLGNVFAFREVAEAGDRGLEMHVHSAGRAVTLLADDDFGLGMHCSHVGLPLEMLFGAWPRLLV